MVRRKASRGVGRKGERVLVEMDCDPEEVVEDAAERGTPFRRMDLEFGAMDFEEPVEFEGWD